MMACTVELFGVARLVARTREVRVELRQGASLADLLAALGDRVPALRGKVILPGRLADGYVCNRNGLEFIRNSNQTVHGGDTIAILSADAGG